MQSTLDAAVYLYFTDGGPTPPRTAAHSFCIELKPIMSAPPLLTDCARLCSPAPAASSGCISPEGSAPSGVCLLLPSHRFYHPHAPRALTCRRGPSPPPLTNLRCSTLLLACKLPRLICCDRSNLLGKAGVCRESSPPSFPKTAQSFHSATPNWMQQRKEVSLKGSKDLWPNPRIQTEVQLHLLQWNYTCLR